MNGKGQTKANWTKHASTKLQVCGVEIYHFVVLLSHYFIQQKENKITF